MKNKFLIGATALALFGAAVAVPQTTVQALYSNRGLSEDRKDNVHNYIQSITAQKVGKNQLKYTIKTKQKFTGLNQIRHFNTANGDEGVSASWKGGTSIEENAGYISKKIDDYTFEVTIPPQKEGYIKLSEVELYMDNSDSKGRTTFMFQPSDLNGFKPGGVVGEGYTQNMNVSLTSGQSFTIASNKKKVTNGDVIVFTVKLSEDLMNLRPNLSLFFSVKNSDGSISSFGSRSAESKLLKLDDNGNFLVFLQIDELYKETAEYVLDEVLIQYPDSNRPKSLVTKTLKRSDLAQFDRSSSFVYKSTKHQEKPQSNTNANKPAEPTKPSKQVKPTTKNGWQREGNTWYYYKNGQTVKNAWVGNYYLKADGKMASGEWVYDTNYKSWFYLSQEGSYINNQWSKIGGTWYHFRSGGYMSHNTWVGNYYLKSSGAMAANEWIYDNSYTAWYYLKGDGSYARNQWQGSYYLKSNGKMAANEWIYDNSYRAWYYLKGDGSYARNEVVQGRYRVDRSGKWI